MDSETDARAYGDRLSKVLNGFRQALHSPKVRIVVGEIGRYLSEWGESEHRPAHWQIVNDELHRLAEALPNCACVSSEGLTHKGDRLHFSTESLRVLGCCYAEAMNCRAESVSANPCSLKFSRVASRRFVLDRELTLCEMNEKTAVAMGVQHPAFGNGLRLVGGFWPAAHYRVHVTGADAAIVFADANGVEKLRFDAPKDELPPYDFSVMLTCGQNPATFVTRNGSTRLVGTCHLSDNLDLRCAENLTKWKFCIAGACERARASLSAGIGQADVRFVMNGRENALYMENGRVFFTFTARSYGSFLAVGSFDPSLFDVRLEGVILFDYGDGLLRNDLASHLFYDDIAGEWRAYVSNFSTGVGSSGTSARAAGGLNVAWSTACPLHGLRIMRAKSLGMTGMNEDPSATWDPVAKKWRLLVSNFPDNGEPMHHIRAKMFESDLWDGPFVPLTDRVAHDSTGTTIQLMNGRKYCFSGSAERKLFVYSYPLLEELGTLDLDFPPWDAECSNGRVWPCFGELPEGCPYRYILLTMDRANFPGMPNPNWTYGGLSIYAANPD